MTWGSIILVETPCTVRMAEIGFKGVRKGESTEWLRRVVWRCGGVAVWRSKNTVSVEVRFPHGGIDIWYLMVLSRFYAFPWP
jgi:hypothetical protein